MKTKLLIAIFTACILCAGCSFAPTQEAVSITTLDTTTVVPITVPADSSSTAETVENTQNTFFAEFFNQNLSYADCSDIVTVGLKDCDFTHEENKTSTGTTISVKGENGNGVITVMSVDVSSISGFEMEDTLKNLGDYYYENMVNTNMSGITDKDFVSHTNLYDSVISKGKYKRSGSINKADGMASQYGYAESYVVQTTSRLTIVSGCFLSSDMMERQSFTTLMSKLDNGVVY